MNKWSAHRRGRYLLNAQSNTRGNFHALIGIRTRDPSKRAALDLRLRPHGHRDWLVILIVC